MKKRTDILFLLPSLCGFLGFFIVPFFASFYYAFIENAFSKKFAGLENFRALLSNEFFRLAMILPGIFAPFLALLLFIFFESEIMEGLGEYRLK